MNPNDHPPTPAASDRRVSPKSAATWWLVALALAAAGFFGVRAWAPGKPKTSSVSAVTPSGPPKLREGSLEGPLADALGTANPLERRLKFLEMVGRADSGDLRRLFRDPRTTQREKRLIAQRWAEVDPNGLFSLIKTVTRTEWDLEKSLFDDIRQGLFRAWVRTDKDAALAAAREVERSPQFRGLSWDLGLALLEVDPATAFALMENTLPWEGGAIPEGVWKADPAAFVRLADQAPGQMLHHHRLASAVSEAFTEWAKSDASAAAQWLKNLPSAHQRALWLRLAKGLAEADPAAAQAWYASLPPSALREQAGAALVEGWAQKDPSAAVAWLQDTLHGGRIEAFSGLARTLTEKGVEAAKGLLDAMPPGPERDQVVTTIARTWAKKDFQPAVAWLASLPTDDPGKRRAINDIGYEWSEKDLAGAAAYVTAEGGRNASSSMLWSVAQKFASTNLTDGVTWAASLPDDPRQAALAHLLEAAKYHQRLPQALDALAPLPPDHAAAAVRHLVSQQLMTNQGQPEADASVARMLAQLPPAWRDEARRVVDENKNLPPERRAAARDALK